jgi:glycosyltransferase 2 family protein
VLIPLENLQNSIGNNSEEAVDRFPETQFSKAWRGRIRGAAIVLGGSAFIYVGVTFWVGRSIWSGRATGELLSLRELPAVIGLVFIGICFRAARFYYYGRRLRWSIPFWPSVVVFVAGFSLTMTPGKAGELLKSALLRARYGTSVAQSAGVLIVERLGDLLALIILASSGFLLFSGLAYYFVFSLAVVVLVCVAPATIIHPLLQWSTRYKRFRPLAERLMWITQTIGSLLKPEPLLIGLTLAAAGWASEACAFSVLAQKLPVTIPLVASFLIVGLSAVIGALSMLPGGLGGVEAVMMLLLTKLGVDIPSAGMTVIMYRLCTLYLMTVIGFCSLGLWKIINPVPKQSRRPI